MDLKKPVLIVLGGGIIVASYLLYDQGVFSKLSLLVKDKSIKQRDSNHKITKSYFIDNSDTEILSLQNDNAENIGFISWDTNLESKVDTSQNNFEMGTEIVEKTEENFSLKNELCEDQLQDNLEKVESHNPYDLTHLEHQDKSISSQPDVPDVSLSMNVDSVDQRVFDINEETKVPSLINTETDEQKRSIFDDSLLVEQSIFDDSLDIKSNIPTEDVTNDLESGDSKSSHGIKEPVEVDVSNTFELKSSNTEDKITATNTDLEAKPRTQENSESKKVSNEIPKTSISLNEKEVSLSNSANFIDEIDYSAKPVMNNNKDSKQINQNNTGSLNGKNTVFPKYSKSYKPKRSLLFSENDSLVADNRKNISTPGGKESEISSKKDFKEQPAKTEVKESLKSLLDISSQKDLITNVNGKHASPPLEFETKKATENEEKTENSNKPTTSIKIESNTEESASNSFLSSIQEAFYSLKDKNLNELLFFQF